MGRVTRLVPDMTWSDYLRTCLIDLESSERKALEVEVLSVNATEDRYTVFAKIVIDLGIFSRSTS